MPPYLPLENMTDRELLISLQGDFAHLNETLEGLLAEQKTCNREVTEKLHELDLFKAGIIATGIADEKSITEKARKEAARTAQVWSLGIATFTLILTTTIQLWIAFKGGGV